MVMTDFLDFIFNAFVLFVHSSFFQVFIPFAMALGIICLAKRLFASLGV